MGDRTYDRWISYRCGTVPELHRIFPSQAFDSELWSSITFGLSVKRGLFFWIIKGIMGGVKRFRIRSIQTLIFSSLLFLDLFPSHFSSFCLAGREIPALPQGVSVFDETNQLNAKEIQPLKDLLSEHQRLTDQKIVFGVFSNIEEEKEEVWSKRTFEKWKLNGPIKGDGLLLALFWQSKNTRVEFGFGLDSRVDAKEVEGAIQECLRKRNLKQSPTKSLFCAAYKLLEFLNSPLIESGKAAEIAQSSDIAEPLNPTGEAEIPWPSILAMSAGILVLLLVLARIILRGRSLSETKLGFLVFWKKQTSLQFIAKDSEGKKESFEDEFGP